MNEKHIKTIFYFCSFILIMFSGIWFADGINQHNIEPMLKGGLCFICGLYPVLSLQNREGSFYIVLTVLILVGIPLFTSWVLLGDKKVWVTDLSGDQILTVFTGFLSYFGTITLGIISMLQNYQLKLTNDKLEASNEKYQRLSMAPYLSFLDVKDIEFTICNQIDYVECYFDKQKVEIVDITNKSSSEKSYFIISFRASNSSNYPITELGVEFEMPKTEFIIKNRTISTAYIEPNGAAKMCIAVSVDKEIEEYWSNNQVSFSLKFLVLNAFQFTTVGKIVISRNGKKVNYTYQIAQFSDMNPLSEDGKAED